MIQITSIPIDILYSILEYTDDKIVKIIYNICEIRKILHENDMNILKILMKYNLNKKYSHKYATDEQFRQYIHNKLIYKERYNIMVNLYNCSDITDVSMLGLVHRLILDSCYNITNVSMLGRIYSLDLSYCQRITDVSALGKIHKLYLNSKTNINIFTFI